MKPLKQTYVTSTYRFPINGCYQPVEPSQSALDFDYAGVSDNTKEVPGNFLQTESLTSGTVAFAIGDTGLFTDALPITCMRHYLRRRLPSDTAPPALMARRVNEIIYDCCAVRSSLSCFYAQYTRASRMLRYVNAGHDAPLLIRRNPDEVLRLQRGGPVFGLQESPLYAEGVIHLKKGDRLVAFTHGVIEALACHSLGAENALIELTRRCPALKPIQLANRIVAECESRSRTIVDKSVLVASLEETNPVAYAPAPMRAFMSMAAV